MSCPVLVSIALACPYHSLQLLTALKKEVKRDVVQRDVLTVNLCR